MTIQPPRSRPTSHRSRTCPVRPHRDLAAMPDRRLKAVWDVRVPVIRELAGVHEYDGVVMDLSPSGRTAALKRLGPSSPDERLADRHDEAHLGAAEQAARAEAEAGILR